MPIDEEATGEVAWYEDNSGMTGLGRRPHDVGLKRSNALGLFDMSGNVREWCFTKSGPKDRRLHGGHWHSNTRSLRIGYHSSMPPELVNTNAGFRIAQTSIE